MSTAHFYDIMHERGLVAQCTDDNIQHRLEKPVTLYCGFDPTADSLHVGSLVPIMGLAHAQRCGHKPLILVGGATGLVGDPSGKTQARQMLTPDTIAHNANAIAKQIGRIVTFGQGPTDAVLVNNIDWIAPLSWIEVLRDIGSRVSVNRMIGMESVKQRMTGDGDGISYLEFSYMLLQAYDFAHLHKEHSCTLQIGGQDQWGNIVMGIELGRKLHDANLAGLTFPLVTKSDGGKFGKSESGNVWLDPARTSPFDFFQFWRNVPDADVGRYLGYFTFLPIDEVRTLAAAQGAAINASKIRLAFEVTQLIHGEAEALKARDAAGSAFSASVDVTGDAIPHADLPANELASGIAVLDLLVRCKLAKSKGEARRLIQGGGIRLHDQKVTDLAHTVTSGDAPDGALLLRAGKKRLFRFDVHA
ncbi:MAG: tyrosine--tRNA ligase [Algisphaera sp.]